MGLSPATDPDDLVPMRIQVTKAQRDWVHAEKRRRHSRSDAAIIREALQAAMDAETCQEKAS
jgi:hypothetical protein